jgi:hypothetical protein
MSMRSVRYLSGALPGLVASVVLAATGCSSDHPSDRVAAGTTNCGSYQAVNGPRPGGVTDAGWTCVATAMHERRPAILRLTQTTTEGDPVRMTFTVRPDGRVDVVTDATHDRFAGSGSRIQKETCTRLDPRPVAKRLLFFESCSSSA